MWNTRWKNDSSVGMSKAIGPRTEIVGICLYVAYTLQGMMGKCN